MIRVFREKIKIKIKIMYICGNAYDTENSYYMITTTSLFTYLINSIFNYAQLLLDLNSTDYEVV